MTTILLIHPLDPRGQKVGGIETHVRQFIRNARAGVRVIHVGIDDTGRLPLGQLTVAELDGESFEFLPLLHFPGEALHTAARSITGSLTFNFLFAMLRHGGTLRRLARETGASADIQRVEFAWACRLLGIPFVQMLHGEGDPTKAMDSLLKRYWFIHDVSERFSVRHCVRFFCVTENGSRRVRAAYPRFADKVETLTVGVDTKVFRPKPFQGLDGPLKLTFMGRLDLFKRPQMMVRVTRLLDEALDGQVEFHYVGKSDPNEIEGFSAVADKWVLHGFRTAREIAELYAAMHIGVLTSEFEGTPVFVLECLAAGRPVVSVQLPQLAHLIASGESGEMLDFNEESPRMDRAFADVCLAVWSSIRQGGMDPDRISRAIAGSTVEALLGRLYDVHAGIQGRATGHAAAPGGPA